jgi:hypothetical protein
VLVVYYVVASEEEAQYITIRQTPVLALILHSLQLGAPRHLRDTHRQATAAKQKSCMLKQNPHAESCMLQCQHATKTWRLRSVIPSLPAV